VRTKYPRLTPDQHVAIANKVKALHTEIINILRAYPKASRASKAAWKLDRALLTLKCALDSEVFKETRGRDPRGLATKVYYGEPFEPKESEDTADAFDGWIR
jgi:hypothetical protein